MDTDQEVGPYNQHGLKNETPVATVEAHIVRWEVHGNSHGANQQIPGKGA